MALKNLQQIRSGCSASIIWSYRTAQFTSHVLNFVIKVLREGKEGKIPLARFYRFLEAITQVKGDECDSALEKFYRFIFRLGKKQKLLFCSLLSELIYIQELGLRIVFQAKKS